MGSFVLSVDEVHAAIRRRLGPGHDDPIVWEDGPDALPTGQPARRGGRRLAACVALDAV